MDSVDLDRSALFVHGVESLVVVEGVQESGASDDRMHILILVCVDACAVIEIDFFLSQELAVTDAVFIRLVRLLEPIVLGVSGIGR